MLFGIFKTFSGSKVQLVEFLYETADTFPLYFIQLSGEDTTNKEHYTRGLVPGPTREKKF